MRRVVLAVLAGLLLFVPALIGAAPARADNTRQDAQSPEARYQACMTQVNVDPQQALETARAWRKWGGGVPAGHCEAAAAFALGKFVDAAQDLEALARDAGPAGPPSGSPGIEVTDPQSRQLLRASLWAQAAQAWLAADRPEEAERAATEAAKLQLRDPAPLILRARAFAAQQRWTDAIADLDRAITLDAKRVDAYVFRASALRQNGVLDRAATDLNAALALDPQHPEALLERGILRRLQGDDAGARADWTALIAAAPDTPAAEEAQRNLKRLDEGTDSPSAGDSAKDRATGSKRDR